MTHYNLDLVESTVIQSTIQSLVASAPASLKNAGNQVKAYHKAVPEDVALPYLVYSRIGGGWDNRAKRDHSNSIYRIVVVTADWAALDTYQTFVDLLHRKMPVSVLTGVEPFHYFEMIVPVMDKITPQNEVIFQVGGHYKLLLSYAEEQ